MQRETQSPVPDHTGHSVAGRAGHQMAGSEFRQPPHVSATQETEARVAPISRFVAQLQNRDGRGWLPDVPPTCGVDAKVLSVLRDPGKYTLTSGVLSAENRDPTTTAQRALFELVSPRDALPWNAHPWYRNITGALRTHGLDTGAEVLADRIDLLPRLRVVLLQGNDAFAAWERVVRSRPRLVEERGIEVLRCFHPSPQALITSNASERQARKLNRQRAYERVAEVLATSAATDSGRQ
jgi:hypothetical protein